MVAQDGLRQFLMTSPSQSSCWRHSTTQTMWVMPTADLNAAHWSDHPRPPASLISRSRIYAAQLVHLPRQRYCLARPTYQLANLALAQPWRLPMFMLVLLSSPPEFVHDAYTMHTHPVILKKKIFLVNIIMCLTDFTDWYVTDMWVLTFWSWAKNTWIFLRLLYNKSMIS